MPQCFEVLLCKTPRLVSAQMLMKENHLNNHVFSYAYEAMYCLLRCEGEVPQIRLYELRHTVISLLLNEGISSIGSAELHRARLSGFNLQRLWVSPPGIHKSGESPSPALILVRRPMIIHSAPVVRGEVLLCIILH